MPHASDTIVTRFAPSPTGFLHIGGARTALFNWLLARKHGGQFLLRIEDTDKARSTQEAIDAILEGLTWLGLDWDGDPVSQSARADRHAEVAEQLLAGGHAYKCFATPEENAAAREAVRAEGRAFLGDLWRDRPHGPETEGKPFVIRMKMPREGNTVVDDAVQGQVTVANGVLDDLVLLRADGSPTYMLSVVVDDHDMGVTDVIRGDDHLNNTFKQVQIYRAMGWDCPRFAHIPLIHGADGKKLSKRHGALGVEAYRDMGYLPEALRNYLLRLGWSAGDEEVIPTKRALEMFSLDGVNKGAARFDFDKLDSINAQYLRHMSPEAVMPTIEPFINAQLDRPVDEDEKARILRALPSLLERAKRYDDLSDAAILFCNTRPLNLSEKAAKQLTADNRVLIGDAIKELEKLADFGADQCKAALALVAEAHDLRLGKVMQPVRAALTGGKPFGDLGELVEILGRAETLGRLRDQYSPGTD